MIIFITQPLFKQIWISSGTMVSPTFKNIFFIKTALRKHSRYAHVWRKRTIHIYCYKLGSGSELLYWWPSLISSFSFRHIVNYCNPICSTGKPQYSGNHRLQMFMHLNSSYFDIHWELWFLWLSLLIKTKVSRTISDVTTTAERRYCS